MSLSKTAFCRLVQEQLGIEAEFTVTLESNLVVDLQADSLAHYLLLETLEDLGAPVPADLAGLLLTVGDLYDHYCQRLGISEGSR